MDINKKCFFCKINDSDSEEHVFPKWLQRKYNLWDQRLTLKNGTTFPYKDIRIPCCSDCNSIYLSKIENEVKLWLEGDSIIDEQKLFVWLLKIMYGLHYKELFLKTNIRDKNSDKIVKPEEVFERASLNAFLYTALDRVRFSNFTPYSIFIYRLENANLDEYFYIDEPYKLYSCIQLGNIGIICSFQDDGYIKKHIELVNEITLNETINKFKFAEIANLVLDLKCRMKMLPNYLVTLHNGKYTFSIQDTDPKEIFKDFNISNFMNNMLKIFKLYFEPLIIKEKEGKYMIKYKSQITYI